MINIVMKIAEIMSYHGTNVNFDRFEKQSIGSNPSANLGFFFGSKGLAGLFAENRVANFGGSPRWSRPTLIYRTRM